MVLREKNNEHQKRILVLGKTGMLGHMVYDYLATLKHYEVLGTTRKELDVEHLSDKDIEEQLKTYHPNIIINGIGIINKYADKNPQLTFKLNSDFPHLLATLGKKYGWKTIHISSDCYLDDDIYGKSKREGEINDEHNLTIRTSIVGPELKQGGGLFHWFMTQQGKTGGYINAQWDGVTTLQLAKFIALQIEQASKTGIIDYRSKQSITKYELLKLIAKTLHKSIDITPDYRAMKDKRNQKADAWCTVTYKEQLEELKNFMEERKQTYHYYFS